MMQFRDAAPTVNAAPSPGGSLLKLLVPAGAGFAVGGPIGGVVGLGAGFLLGRGGAVKTVIVPPELQTDPTIPSVTPLTAQQQAELADGAGKPDVAGLLASEVASEVAAKLISVGLAAGYAIVQAGGSIGAAAAAAGEAIQHAAAAAGPAIIIVADALGVALAVANMLGYDPMGFKPMWDALSPAQQKMYTDCLKTPGIPACDMANLIKAGVMGGSGTGAKQILVGDEYVTVGRTASGEILRPQAGVDADTDPVVRNGTTSPDGAWTFRNGKWWCNSGHACSNAPSAKAGAPIPWAEGRPQSRYMLGDAGFGDYFGDIAYVVQSGDSLTSIALAHGLCTGGTRTNPDWTDCIQAASRIAVANNIANVDQIYPGQSLIIPDVTARVVQTSDGPVAVPVPSSKSALPWILGLGVLGAFLVLGRH